MAKFIKSIFNTSDRRKSTRYDEPIEDKDFPPLDGRRKLSISRSGRMKQANRKRHSLSLELYGENFQPLEKSKTVDYHVDTQTNQSTFIESKKTDTVPRRNSADGTSPEQEIDIAFKIIDNT